MLGGVTKDKGTCASRPGTPSGPKKGQNEQEASLATSTTPNPQVNSAIDHYQEAFAFKPSIPTPTHLYLLMLNSNEAQSVLFQIHFKLLPQIIPPIWRSLANNEELIINVASILLIYSPNIK